MPSKEKVEKVLKLQWHYRSTLPQFNFFGENNWEELDLAIQLLTNHLNGITNAWFDKWHYIDQSKFQGATNVMDWLDGTFDEDYFDEELETEGIN